MDIQRIQTEVLSAGKIFAFVEAHPTSAGEVFVKTVLQTSAATTYVASILFPNYPYQMPKVFITKPTLQPSPHRYPENQICYLHPNMWNPGRHDLTFVLGHAAKWLNKYEVYCRTGRWPGASLQH